MAREAPSSGSGARAAREALGLSQRQLGELLGVSDRMVRKIETAGVIPAGYRETYRALTGGRVVAPTRRVTSSGTVRVRAAGGGTREVRPAKGGSTPTGVTFARGTSRDAPIVRRTVVAMPYADTPHAEGWRDSGAEQIGQAVRDAHTHGMRAVVTVGQAANPAGAGGGQAAFDVTVIGLPDGAAAPRRGVVIDPGDDWDPFDVYELADDAGLLYDS